MNHSERFPVILNHATFLSKYMAMAKLWALKGRVFLALSIPKSSLKEPIDIDRF